MFVLGIRGDWNPVDSEIDLGRGWSDEFLGSAMVVVELSTCCQNEVTDWVRFFRTRILAVVV